MSDLLVDFLFLLAGALFYMIPSWLANAFPLLFGHGQPIDHGRFWKDGKRIFGDHKTQRGFAVGIIAGLVGGGGMMWLWDIVIPPILEFLFLPTLANPLIPLFQKSVFYSLVPIENDIVIGLLFGFAASLGAMTGDLFGSFLKRRCGIQSGESFIPMDQLGFFIFALVFAFPIAAAPIEYWLLLTPITFSVHVFANVVGYILKLSDSLL